MGEYNFTDKGFEHYLYWQNKDRKILKRINQLLQSIDREGPLNGIGKPEALKYETGYSRRIDSENRLVYDVSDGRITVRSCRGHYDE
jgi:toxin YoeB